MPAGLCVGLFPEALVYGWVYRMYTDYGPRYAATAAPTCCMDHSPYVHIGLSDSLQWWWSRVHSYHGPGGLLFGRSDYLRAALVLLLGHSLGPGLVYGLRLWAFALWLVVAFALPGDAALSACMGTTRLYSTVGGVTCASTLHAIIEICMVCVPRHLAL